MALNPCWHHINALYAGCRQSVSAPASSTSMIASRRHTLLTKTHQQEEEQPQLATSRNVMPVQMQMSQPQRQASTPQLSSLTKLLPIHLCKPQSQSASRPQLTRTLLIPTNGAANSRGPRQLQSSPPLHRCRSKLPARRQQRKADLLFTHPSRFSLQLAALSKMLSVLLLYQVESHRLRSHCHSCRSLHRSQLLAPLGLQPV